MRARRSLPLLSPSTQALRMLTRMPLPTLRAAAEQRGIAVTARATREHIAMQLVSHASREQSDAQYRATGIAFDSRDTAYPQIRRLVTRHRLRRILDVGCGPGLFADELYRSGALPANGAYMGFDVSPAAVELARARLAIDSRFVFHVGDAEDVETMPIAEVDGILISFVLTYLDTHAVDRLVETLARRYPQAMLVAALTFRSSVDLLDDVEPDEARELRAARRYLAGDRAAAKGLWDTRRLACYRESVERSYDLIEERALKPQAQMLWVGRPRKRAR